MDPSEHLKCSSKVFFYLYDELKLLLPYYSMTKCISIELKSILILQIKCTVTIVQVVLFIYQPSAGLDVPENYNLHAIIQGIY